MFSLEIKAYVLNLTNLENDGGVKGAWFTPPINVEDMKEKIGLKDNHKYAIADIYIVGQKWPFDTDEYTPIEEINRLCSLLKKIEETPVEIEMQAIQKKFFNSFEEMVNHVEDIVWYSECHDMRDMARYLINKKEGISEKLMGYVDYEAYGRHLDENGNYLVTSHGVFECLR